MFCILSNFSFLVYVQVLVRNRRRRAGERRRPWSITEQLNRLSSSQPCTPMQEAHQAAVACNSSTTRSLQASTSDPALRAAEQSHDGGLMSSSQTDLAESLNVSEDQKAPQPGPASTSFSLRGCASDSALYHQISKRSEHSK